MCRTLFFFTIFTFFHLFVLACRKISVKNHIDEFENKIKVDFASSLGLSERNNPWSEKNALKGS